MRQSIGALATAIGIGSGVLAEPTLGASLPTVPSDASRSEVATSETARSSDRILNALSDRFGFIFIGATEIPRTLRSVPEVSNSPERTLESLEGVLGESNLATIKEGRIVVIAELHDALYRKQPVRIGRDPEAVPPGPELATHVIPLSAIAAGELMKNLSSLLPLETKLTANEAANALVVTGTGSAINRSLKIAAALDRVPLSGSEIRVLPIRYSDSIALAAVFNELFGSKESSAQPDIQVAVDPLLGAQFASGQQSATEATPASRRALSAVAVGEEHSNSLVMRAPPSLYPTIAKVLSALDVPMQESTVIRLLRLRNSDSTETATLLSALFSNEGDSEALSQRDRRIRSEKLIAVPDARTSALLLRGGERIVVAAAELARRLDEDPARKQRLAIFTVEHGDPETIVPVLKQLFEASGSLASDATESALQVRRRQTTTTVR